MPGWIEILKERAPGKVLVSEPFNRHCSFKVGGPADAWFEPRDADALCQAVRILGGAGIPYIVLGGGTNVLPGDTGFRGAVIRLRVGFDSIVIEEPGGCVIRAGAGAQLKALLDFARSEMLAGMAYAAGIPGTVGGAIACNAGTGIGDTKGVLKEIEIMGPDGETRWVAKDAIRFAYRSAAIPSGAVVLSARFGLKKGDDTKEAQKVLEKRDATQPRGFPCAGSVFKNPPGDSAGRLIDAAGLKGMRVGGAEISKVHANFIVNTGGATASEIARLMSMVKGEVKRLFKVNLEPEIWLIGGFTEGANGF